jgi:hypothetical protein
MGPRRANAAYIDASALVKLLEAERETAAASSLSAAR